jgi:hypothetical protein
MGGCNAVWRKEDAGTRAARFVPTPMLAFFGTAQSKYPLFLSGQSSICSLRARSLPLFWPSSAVRPWVRGGVRGFPEEAPIESEVANISVIAHGARRRAQYAPYLLIYTSSMWRVSRCVPW